MSITSLIFVAFCFLIVCIYWSLPYKLRWVWLLIANIVFYMCFGIGSIIFMLAVSMISWAGCIMLMRVHKEESAYLKKRKAKLSREAKKKVKCRYEIKRKVILAVILVLILGQLVIIKYNGFILQNVNAVFHTDYLQLGIIMPLGISFYTIFVIGYCIDVYRGSYDAEKNLLRHTAVVSFFPCITQGPIERYENLSKQIFAKSEFHFDRIKQGAYLMLWGFFKKLVIADNLSVLTNTVFLDNTGTYKGLYILIAAVLYAVQLYADFSGYTDIVRGVSEALGISLIRNFESPYFSRDVAEFWRRWHISLGTWFKDYVFYPALRSGWCQKLGKIYGEKFSRAVSVKITTTAGLLINWILIGLWHGSSWKYIFYGLYYGLIMIISIWLKPVYDNIKRVFKINTNCFSWRAFQTVRTFLIVSFGYILFCADGFMNFIRLVKDMIFNINPWIFFDGGIFTMGIDPKSAFMLMAAVAILITVDVLHDRGHEIREEIAVQNTAFRWLLLYGVIFAIIIFGAYGPEYNASDFIYQGF